MMNTQRTTKCLGFASYTTTNAAFGLTTAPQTGVTFPSTDPSALGPRPQWCILQAEAKNLRYRDDGTDPTTTVGMILYAGQSFVYDGDMNKIRFIQTESGSILNCLYYT